MSKQKQESRIEDLIRGKGNRSAASRFIENHIESLQEQEDPKEENKKKNATKQSVKNNKDKTKGKQKESKPQKDKETPINEVVTEVQAEPAVSVTPIPKDKKKGSFDFAAVNTDASQIKNVKPERTQQTFLMDMDLIEIIDDLAAINPRGFKTNFLNAAIRFALEEYDLIPRKPN